MRLLLDTHVFIWAIKNDRRLTKKARTQILQAADVFVSSASIWEAIIKIKLKKLDIDVDELVGAIPASGFLELPISVKHAAEVSQLDDHHRDPFDRILIAQAISEPLIFLTADVTLNKYSDLVQVIDE